MKKFLTYLTAVLIMLPCVFVFSACNDGNKENFAVFYEGDLQSYEIDTIQFCSSYAVEDSYINVNTYTTTYYEETGRTGVEKDDVDGDLYIHIVLKQYATIGILKMLIDGQEVQLDLVSAGENNSYFYKFASTPSNAKITFSGKAEYMSSTFSFEFAEASNACLSNQNYLDARFALKHGNTYLIGSAQEGVNFATFKTQYETVDKSWLLDEKLCLEVYFANKDRILSTYDILEVQTLTSESFVGATRYVKDGVVTFLLDENKEGLKITLNPNYLMANTTDLGADIGMDTFALPCEEVLYVVDGTEYDSVTYEQTKNATYVKIKLKLNEFLKTILESNKVAFNVNRKEFDKNNLVVQGDYAVMTVDKPWDYYSENDVTIGSGYELLDYLIEFYPLIKNEEMLELYTIDDILGENSNLTKIAFSGVNNLFAILYNTGYSGGLDDLKNSLYVDISANGENYLAGYRSSQDFSIKCKIAYLNENVMEDYSKDIVLLINNDIEITLSYDSNNKLNYKGENVTVTTSTSFDNIIDISFTGIDVSSISFQVAN